MSTATVLHKTFYNAARSTARRFTPVSVRSCISKTRSRLRERGTRWFWQTYGLLRPLPAIHLDELIGARRWPLEPPITDYASLPRCPTADHDDYTPLMQVLKAHAPRVVLELGTARGNLTANICRQCHEAMVYTVNAPAEEQTGAIVTYRLSRDQIGIVYRQHGFDHRVRQIYANTLVMKLDEHLGFNSIDLAVIDACHDRSYVINDFEKVVPFVRDGGIVFLHDTHPTMSAHLIGSYSACLTLRRRGYDIRHIRDTWWGVWLKESRQGGEN